MEPVSFAKGEAVVVPACVPAVHGAAAVGAGDHAHVAANGQRCGTADGAWIIDKQPYDSRVVRPATAGMKEVSLGESANEQFLSRHSRRRPRHALLAAEPQAQGQATAAAQQREEHDPGNGRAACASRAEASSFWIITNEDLRDADRAAASRARYEADHGRARRTQHRTGDWTGGISAGAAAIPTR